jgi:hypothetical protein
MRQGKRRRVERVSVADIEVLAGGTHWPVQFTRQFDQDSELDQVEVQVGNDDGEYRAIELLPAPLAAGIRQGIADWCEKNPPEPDYDDRDEAYERAASRSRSNDFERTGGKDWT